MRIRLDQIGDEPFTWREARSWPVADLDHPELVALGEVEHRGSITHTDPGYYLRAGLDYEQTLTCNRCLAPYVEPVTGELELLVLTSPPSEELGERELEEEELGVVHVDGEVLDLEPLLREQLLLNVPMKPLCRADCRGLCPGCGADRNREACGCEAVPMDPRWEALAALRRGSDD